VTPERIAGNPAFLEILKCLHLKVSCFCRFLVTIAILFTIKSISFNGAPCKSQGQLAGFVVDEAHCVRYGLF
jgi:superfamily II DNA helicase RecQ